jgi:hypothetical protein
VPEAFVVQRWADLGATLGNPLAAAIHARAECWVLDEFAMPGQLFEESWSASAERTGSPPARSRLAAAAPAWIGCAAPCSP